jgi:perosamine synthetase
MSKLAISGGSPIREKVFENRKTMGSEELAAVTRVLDSDILSGFLGAPGVLFNGGKEVQGFEQAWGTKYGYKYVISMNSASTALQAAVGAVGIEPGDEVICSPYSMSVSATAALFYGGVPVFADLDPNSICMDPASIEKNISSRTKAIIVVHLFGFPAEMDKIMAIAQPLGIKVIEDAAQAPGSIYKGKYVGTWGDLGIFSLNFHKHIHTGEGGMIVTNNDNLALRCQLIRNHGENAAEAYGVDDISNIIGSNYRLTEIQAAIASEQMKKLDNLLIRRRQLAAYMNSRLSGISGLTLQILPDNCTHSYYLFPFRYDENIIGVPRTVFLKAVSAELPKPTGWETTPLAEGYVKPLYLNIIYQKQIAIGKHGFPFNQNPDIKYNYSKGICPVVERLYEKGLLYSPLIREPLSINDMKDFADSFEKVVTNIEELKRNKKLITTGVFDAVAAVNETKNCK